MNQFGERGWTWPIPQQKIHIRDVIVCIFLLFLLFIFLFFTSDGALMSLALRMYEDSFYFLLQASIEGV